MDRKDTIFQSTNTQGSSDSNTGSAAFATTSGKIGSMIEDYIMVRKSDINSFAKLDKTFDSSTASLTGKANADRKSPIESGANGNIPATDQKLSSVVVTGDMKMDQAKPKLRLSIPNAIRQVMKRSLRTTLVITSVSTSAANTALTTVLALTPSYSSEFSSFAALFDSVKVHGCRVNYSISASAAITSPSLAVVAYQPTDVSALTSIASGCETDQHQLVSLAPAALTSAQPQAVTSRGLWSKQFIVPKGSPARSSATSTTFGNEWASTSDTDDAFGYLKIYLGALGTGVVSTWTYVLYVDCSFRARQ
jgi:hypothetical protein